MDDSQLQQQIDKVQKALDVEDAEVALQAAVQLAEDHPDHPDVLLLVASAAYYSDVPDLCREACEKVLQKTSQARVENPQKVLRQARIWLARVAFRMWEFTEAESRLRQLLTEDPKDAESWNQMARLLELTGRHQESQSADEAAARLDPENYPHPQRLSDDELEQAARDALEQLPPPFQTLLAEVPIVIEDFPDYEMSSSSDEQQALVAPDTLGLFIGTSLLERSFFNVMEAPGTIFLFKRNLERECSDRETLIREITITLWHELAHFLGFEEEDMPRLGLE